MKSILIFLFLTLCVSTRAETVIAILDNIIDIEHSKLAPYLNKNHLEVFNNEDDDQNGLIDDVHGWNFINENENVFNEELRGSFSKDVFKYYRIRKKKTLETISKAELAWYNKIRKDEDFVKERKAFSKYTHGSHVACLAMDKSHYPSDIKKSAIKFYPITYLGDAESGRFHLKKFEPLKSSSTSKKHRHIQNYVNYYIKFMQKKFQMAVSYATTHAHIINASWGQGHGTSEKIVNRLYREQFNLDEDDETTYASRKKAIVREFIDKLIRNGSKIVNRYPNHLFIFSAGNKKEDTDIKRHYPSGIQAQNVISVGAFQTHKGKLERAYFSNYGQNTITISAPGIAIDSCTPDEINLPINGTSQAAPQVAKAAALVRERLLKKRSNVKASDIKNIIVKSSTKYSSLRDSNINSSILNLKSALRLSK